MLYIVPVLKGVSDRWPNSVHGQVVTHGLFVRPQPTCFWKWCAWDGACCFWNGSCVIGIARGVIGIASCLRAWDGIWCFWNGSGVIGIAVLHEYDLVGFFRFSCVAAHVQVVIVEYAPQVPRCSTFRTCREKRVAQMIIYNDDCFG